jgi:hypothetical protein
MLHTHIPTWIMQLPSSNDTETCAKGSNDWHDPESTPTPKRALPIRAARHVSLGWRNEPIEAKIYIPPPPTIHTCTTQILHAIFTQDLACNLQHCTVQVLFAVYLQAKILAALETSITMPHGGLHIGIGLGQNISLMLPGYA